MDRRTPTLLKATENIHITLTMAHSAEPNPALWPIVQNFFADF
jgi:hypothetical protein